MSVYNNILKYLPNFIKSKGKKINGHIHLTTAPTGSSYALVGTDTKFTQDIKVNDTLIFWKPDSENNLAKATVNSITDDTNANITLLSATFYEDEINASIVANPITQTLLITIDNQLTNLIGEINSDFRFGHIARRQIAKEYGLFIGKWESVAQLNLLLQNMYEIHQRRGCEGVNMTSLDDIGAGILGECDRISKNPQLGVGSGTEIEKGEGLLWVLAGDIEYVFDGAGVPSVDTTSTSNLLWRYPDFTIPTAIYPRATYSPGLLAVCWLDTLDMYIIIIENKNETNFTNRQIEQIIEKLVPIDLPYLVQFV